MFPYVAAVDAPGRSSLAEARQYIHNQRPIEATRGGYYRQRALKIKIKVRKCGGSACIMKFMICV